jgi:hypothetical protein
VFDGGQCCVLIGFGAEQTLGGQECDLLVAGDAVRVGLGRRVARHAARSEEAQDLLALLELCGRNERSAHGAAAAAAGEAVSEGLGWGWPRMVVTEERLWR